MFAPADGGVGLRFTPFAPFGVAGLVLQITFMPFNRGAGLRITPLAPDDDAVGVRFTPNAPMDAGALSANGARAMPAAKMPITRKIIKM